MGAYKHRIPDLLTYTRVAFAPLLWLLGLLHQERAAGAVLLAAAATDVLDGRLSRRWGVTSPAGSKVDALADTGMGITALGLLILLEPDVIRNYPLFFTAMPIVALLLLIWGYRVLGKVADLHMTAGRAAGAAAYLFLVALFLLDARLEPLLYLVMALSTFLALETIVAIRTRGRFSGQHSQVLAWWMSSRRERRGPTSA